MSTLESFVSAVCLGIQILIIIDESETSNWDLCLPLILHPFNKLNFDISSLHSLLRVVFSIKSHVNMFQHAFILGFPSAYSCLIGFLSDLCFLLSIAKMPASYSIHKRIITYVLMA